MSNIFKILSIDGGGIRGVYPAHILRCIEERLNINLFDTFDMIAGTSTGSIIAASIAIGTPASKIVNMYEEQGIRIFRKKQFYWLHKNMFDSSYDAQRLEAALIDVFQDKQLGDIEKAILIPSTDIGNGCVHVLKSGYSEKFIRDKNVKIKDAVLASCSAPTFFDPHGLNEYLLADGGLWANNPALAAVLDAQKILKIAQNNIRILSIGTGYSKTIYKIETLRRWGFLRRWGLINGWRHKKLIDFIFSLQNQSTLNYLKLMLRADQIKRIDFEYSLPLSLDDVSILRNLISIADKTFNHQSDSIKQFILDQ